MRCHNKKPTELIVEEKHTNMIKKNWLWRKIKERKGKDKKLTERGSTNAPLATSR